MPHVVLLPYMFLKGDIFVIKRLPLQPTDETRVLDYFFLVLLLRPKMYVFYILKTKFFYI